MTDSIRLMDSAQTAPEYRQYAPKAFIPIAAFDAMTDDEQREIVNAAPLMSALEKAARMQAESQQEGA